MLALENIFNRTTSLIFNQFNVLCYKCVAYVHRDLSVCRTRPRNLLFVIMDTGRWIDTTRATIDGICSRKEDVKLWKHSKLLYIGI